MYRSKCWEVFQRANQGICIFNCKLDKIYANKKARQVFGTLTPELYQQFKGICRSFLAMVRAKKTSLLNYSGMLNFPCYIISFNCFSFYSAGQRFILVVFDYQAGGENDSAEEVTFTPREKDILLAIANGKTNKEISEMLCIGFETVKSHVRNLLAKTGTSSRTELISKHCHLEDYTVGLPDNETLRKSKYRDRCPTGLIGKTGEMPARSRHCNGEPVRIHATEAVCFGKARSSHDP